MPSAEINPVDSEKEWKHNAKKKEMLTMLKQYFHNLEQTDQKLLGYKVNYINSKGEVGPAKSISRRFLYKIKRTGTPATRRENAFTLANSKFKQMYLAQ